MKIYIRGVHPLVIVFVASLLIAPSFCQDIQGAEEAEYIEKTLYLPQVTSADNVTLRSITDYYEVSVPIPNRWDVKRVVITFDYSNSISITEKRSQLLVTCDDIPLAQIRLTPASPEGRATISLPKSVLTPGYHRLRFSVIQHFGDECEDPFSPELWTTLKLKAAKITYFYEAKKIPVSLSRLDEYFDPKDPEPVKVNIVMEGLNSEIINIALAGATSVAVRYVYKPVTFIVSDQVQPRMDNIIIGKRQFVAEVLGPAAKTELVDSNIFMTRVPDSPDHLAIILTGATNEEIKTAALALASLNFPFPNSRKARIKKVDFPTFDAFTGKRLITPGVEYSFLELGLHTTVFKGMGSHRKNITFRLPSDLHILPNQYASVYLHLAYGAGLRQDSSLILYLNDIPVTSIHLKNPDGEVFESYKIAIPTYMFRPGKNILSFEPALVPSESGKCEILKDNHLFVTIYKDSRLRFPKMSHWVKMPNLSLLLDGGFPFTKMPDGSEIALLIPKPEPFSICAAFNVLSILAQKNGLPFTGVKLYHTTDNPELKGKDILFIGSYDQMDDKLLKYAPLVLKEKNTFQYLIARSKPKGNSKGIRGLLDRWIEQGLSPSKWTDRWSVVEGQWGKPLSSYAVLCEFVSPYGSGRSVVALTSPSEDMVGSAAKALWDSSVQANISGDFVIISLQKPIQVKCLKLAKPYYSGQLRTTQKLDFYLHRYPWLYLAAALVGLFLLGIIVFIYLKRRHKRRLAIEQGKHEGD